MPGYATTLRNTRQNDIRNAIDAGAGAGTLSIYAGTQPATGGAVGGATLLGTLTFSDPSAADAAAGVLSFSAITQDASADATGTATWARAKDSTGAFVADFTVGGPGSGKELILNNANITQSGAIQVVSLTITEGNA